MTVRSFLLTALVILFIASARSAYAGSEQTAVGNPGVVVQWFVRASTSTSPVRGNHYEPPQPIQGLWQSPDERELQRIYLDRFSDRRSDQAVPLLIVEW